MNISMLVVSGNRVIPNTLALTDHDGEGEFCVPNRVILDALKELPEQPLHFDVDAAGEAVLLYNKKNISYPLLRSPSSLHRFESVLQSYESPPLLSRKNHQYCK